MSVSDLSSVTTLGGEREDERLPVLPIGLIVGGRYEIKNVLGVGGNGAVYEGAGRMPEEGIV